MASIEVSGLDSSSSSSNGRLAEEIDQLKTRYRDECRVIEKIGDFVCVVQVTLREFGITVKFQVSGL